MNQHHTPKFFVLFCFGLEFSGLKAQHTLTLLHTISMKIKFVLKGKLTLSVCVYLLITFSFRPTPDCLAPYLLQAKPMPTTTNPNPNSQYPNFYISHHSTITHPLLLLLPHHGPPSHFPVFSPELGHPQHFHSL